MEFIEVVSDIKSKLENGRYRNEEHVRLNLVTRVLQGLGWDIWDPLEVYTELSPTPTEDNTRVDFALFAYENQLSVLIEVKPPGALARGALPAAELQLRDYNRNNTAPLSVITDGDEWRLYLSQTGGEFSQKCFKALRIRATAPDDACAAFTAFLSKSAIQDGSAVATATGYHRMNQRQRAMADCLPEARRQVQTPPFRSLPDILVDLVRTRGIEVSQEEAVGYLGTARDRDAAGSELHSREGSRSPNEQRPAASPTARLLPPDNPGDLRFTEILRGSIENAGATRWNDLVCKGIALAIQRGTAVAELRATLPVNLQEGDVGERGFVLVPGTSVSMQNMDATRAARALVAIARKFGWRLHIHLRWGSDSPHAGQEGLLAVEP
jgi:hypothetical protein